eukprot:6552422-Prymnesium_polylepis.2
MAFWLRSLYKSMYGMHAGDKDEMFGFWRDERGLRREEASGKQKNLEIVTSKITDACGRSGRDVLDSGGRKRLEGEKKVGGKQKNLESGRSRRRRGQGFGRYGRRRCHA